LLQASWAEGHARGDARGWDRRPGRRAPESPLGPPPGDAAVRHGEAHQAQGHRIPPRRLVGGGGGDYALPRADGRGLPGDAGSAVRRRRARGPLDRGVRAIRRLVVGLLVLAGILVAVDVGLRVWAGVWVGERVQEALGLS